MISHCGFYSVEQEVAILEAAGAEVVDDRAAPQEKLLQDLRTAFGCLSETLVYTRDLLAQMPECRIICEYAVGYEVVDLEAASEAGILVCNVPGYCAAEVADHAWALALCVWRKVKGYEQSLREGLWDPLWGRPIHRLEGRCLGLVGFGSVARGVARRARAHGMRVLAYDPYVSPAQAEAEEARLTGLEQLCREADILSLHVPLTVETTKLIDRRLLALLKPAAVVVNTARGGVIDEEVLAERLRDGTLAGAALDVFDQEPPPRDSPLFTLSNVVLTSHCAFYSEEALEELQRRAAQQVAAVLGGQRPAHLLNPEALGKRVVLATSGP